MLTEGRLTSLCLITFRCPLYELNNNFFKKSHSFFTRHLCRRQMKQNWRAKTYPLPHVPEQVSDINGHFSSQKNSGLNISTRMQNYYSFRTHTDHGVASCQCLSREKIIKTSIISLDRRGDYLFWQAGRLSPLAGGKTERRGRAVKAMDVGVSLVHAMSSEPGEVIQI